MGSTVYEFGGFALDASKRLVTREGEVVPLAPKTFDLLLLLVESGGRALPKKELMHALWPDTFVEEANLSFQISILRKALGENGAKWIETIPKHGYRFTADVHRVDIAAEVPLAPPPTQADKAGRRRKSWNRWTGLWRLAAIGAAAALVVTISIWMAWRMSPASNDSPAVSPATPLTALPGHQQNPSLSPNGDQVAFSWDGPNSDNNDIYIKLVGPSEPIRLTTDPAIDEQPAWSPDGASIAFLRFRTPGHADLIVIPALGGAERKAASVSFDKGRGDVRSTSTQGWTGNLSWTPDGKWLAFGGAPSEDAAPGIWLVAVNGGEQRRLTTVTPPDLGEWVPRFTRDGRYMAFLRERTLSRLTVCVIPLSQLTPAGAPQRVSPYEANIQSLAWKPDDSGFVFSSAGHLGLSRTYSMPYLPGKTTPPGEVRLLPFGERARGISVALNSRIVYAAERRDANIWRANLSSLSQRSQVPIAVSTLDEQTPEYSPDGNRLAFASTRSGAEEIWLADVDGSNPKQLTSMGGPQCSNPRWSPDGQLILFNARREGSADLYLLNPVTSELRRITNDPHEELEPRWSRDGRTIYFGSNRTGRFEVWRMAATGGEPVQITHDGGCTATESPDGRFLFYAKHFNSPSEIWRVPVGGGKEEPVTGGLTYSLNFVVARRGIYFLARDRAPNETSLDLVDYATGKKTVLVKIGKTFWFGMALSPDEKSLLYSVIDSTGSNLMLVESSR